ncbi:hypothetical protein OIU77_019155 [Salix suchowensis]|uniref:Uncharacterized protein n=1 Tax=Salix suchowensis TaxID=1278906 RepID=A0ABQ9CG21_9ROSI|nr:hypothetical protein OIU77_019155 [Salix suchowensis]
MACRFTWLLFRAISMHKDVILSLWYIRKDCYCGKEQAYVLSGSLKLRKTLNITGGFVDDFLSHLMCCCCALVQEWREVEIRGVYGPEKTKTSPPPSQFMES